MKIAFEMSVLYESHKVKIMVIKYRNSCEFCYAHNTKLPGEILLRCSAHRCNKFYRVNMCPREKTCAAPKPSWYIFVISILLFFLED